MPNFLANNWHHIVSKLNPADLAIIELIFYRTYNYVRKARHTYINQQSVHQTSKEVLREERKTIIATITANVINDVDLIDRYSCFKKRIRITDLLLCFVHMCTFKKITSGITYGYLAITEIETARKLLIITIQWRCCDICINKILSSGKPHTFSALHSIPRLQRLP